MVAELEGGVIMVHGRDLTSRQDGRKSSAQIVTLVATFFFLLFLFLPECSGLMQPALSRSRPRYLFAVSLRRRRPQTCLQCDSPAGCVGDYCRA